MEQLLDECHPQVTPLGMCFTLLGMRLLLLDEAIQHIVLSLQCLLEAVCILQHVCGFGECQALWLVQRLLLILADLSIGSAQSC